METLKHKLYREKRRWNDNLILTFVFAFVLMLGGQLLSIHLGADYLTFPFSSDPDVRSFMGLYAEFLGIWVLTILAISIFKFNRPMLKLLFPNIKKILIGIVIGGIGGFVLNSINVCAALLLGDIKLSFNKIEILPILGFIIFICIQSGAEEIIDRLYIYQKLRRRFKNPFVAVFGNALFFFALHLGNPGLNYAAFAELFGWGVLFALIVLYFDNIWISIAMHTAWNFTQNIFYGLPNSGIVSGYSIFKLDAASSDFFFDTGFGVEGSWGAVIILAVICTVLIIKYKTYEKNDVWAEQK